MLQKAFVSLGCYENNSPRRDQNNENRDGEREGEGYDRTQRRPH